MAQQFEGTSNGGEANEFTNLLLEHEVSDTAIQSLIKNGLKTMYVKCTLCICKLFTLI